MYFSQNMHLGDELMTGFFMAWGMFSIIPCPCKVWDDNKYSSMLLCFPFIGIMIGFFWMVVYFLLEKILYLACLNTSIQLLRSVMLVISPWILSGFIHLDGFLDCSDAVLSRRNRDERLRILKDSSVGAFAVIIFGLYSMISIGVFSAVSFQGRSWVFILIPAISRACSSISLLLFKPLSTSSYQCVLDDKRHKQHSRIALLILFSLIVITLVISILRDIFITSFFCFFEITSFFITVLILKKNLGGVSGDISGSAITISELIAVVSLIFV